MRQRYYVKYSANGIIVPMSLVIMSGFPKNGQWKELFSVCCDPAYEPFLSFEKNKAFVQITKQGKPVGGPIILKRKPKSGFYIQVPYNLCCSLSVLPQITTQPLSQTVDEGDTATFTVVATGRDLQYQWYLDGVEIDGAISASYTTPTLTDTDSGTYTVVVYNDYGTIESQEAELTVTPQ